MVKRSPTDPTHAERERVSWMSSEDGWQRSERPKFKERPANWALYGELAAAWKQCMGEALPDDLQDAVRALAARVNAANSGRIRKNGLDVELGILFGNVLSNATGWDFIDFRDARGRTRSEVVASPDRRFFVDPRAFMRAQLGLDGIPVEENTTVLLFNMIVDGKRLPDAAPLAYRELS